MVALWRLRANRNPRHVHHRVFLERVLGIHTPIWPRTPQLPIPDTLPAGIRGTPIFPTGPDFLPTGHCLKKHSPLTQKKGNPQRITLSDQPAPAASAFPTGNITFYITIIYAITGNIASTITASSTCRHLHNLNSLLCQHLEADILKFELLDLATAG